MKRIILFLLVFTFLTGCSEHDSIDMPVPGLSQQYVFEVEFENHAWGHQYYGYVVDVDGIVYRYDYSGENTFEASWYHPDDPVFPQDELDAKYGMSPIAVDTLGSEDLSEAIQLIAGAAGGRLTDPNAVMADAGVARYSCFTYSDDTEIYNKVLLLQDGDILILNTSSDAIDLINWLMSSVRKDDIPRFDY